MEFSDLKGMFTEISTRMDASVERVRRDMASVRTGRASVSLLDHVQVEAYGSKMPLNQVASLSVPEPSLIVVQPFDPGLMSAIERGIRISDLGLNPANDGKVVRIPIPSLTEERRKELTKVVRNAGEDAKVAVRNLRRDANDHAKKLMKDKEISEDEERRSLDDLQKLTDRMIAEIDRLVTGKEAEIMAV